MVDVSHIRDYILYLKETHNLNISLHYDRRTFLLSATELKSFNIHDISYCAAVKTSQEAFRHCCLKKQAICKKCADGSFVGVCHAGVREFVYPIWRRGDVAGFISVSGYRTENADSYIRRISRKYRLDCSMLQEKYSLLRSELPSKSQLDSLIRPLCDMLELLYLKESEKTESELSFPEKIAAYIDRNHTQNICSADICDYFSCSRSHISTQFNGYMKKSIREYINELRIRDAEYLLANSNLTVTEIAFSVGYTDSNYFSCLFKRRMGISPARYREHTKKRK